MNEDMNGLASKGANRQPSIQEVVQMIKQGIEPEELVEQGIPEELVQAAVQVVMQEMGQAGGMQAQTTPAAQPEGLAGSRVEGIPDPSYTMR